MRRENKASFWLTDKAKADLKQISRHTRVQWGHDQRTRYLAELDAAYHRIAKHAYLGQSCAELQAGVFAYHIGSHTIYFRRMERGVEILRILHQRQDALRQIDSL